MVCILSILVDVLHRLLTWVTNDFGYLEAQMCHYFDLFKMQQFRWCEHTLQNSFNTLY